MKTQSAYTIVHLDSVDRDLVRCVQRDPSAPYGQWAEELGISAATVARRFRRLNTDGVLRVIGRTSAGFGGRLSWIVRVGCPVALVKQLASELYRLEVTRWVRVTHTRDEVFCGVVESTGTIADVIALLHKRLPGTRVAVHQIVRTWPQPPMSDGDSAIDRLDDRLLALLSIDGRRSHVDLAREIGVDPATVSRRKKRLEDAGILYYEASVADSLFGTAPDYHLWLSVAPGYITTVGSHLAALDSVNFVAATAGSWSLLADVEVDYPIEIVDFVDALKPYGVIGYELVPMGQTVKGYVYT